MYIDCTLNIIAMNLRRTTLPQHIKAFIDVCRKNTNYTLRNIFLVNKLFQNSDLRRYYSYNFETSPQHKAFMDTSMKHTNYTLRNIQFELVSEYTLRKFLSANEILQ